MDMSASTFAPVVNAPTPHVLPDRIDRGGALPVPAGLDADDIAGLIGPGVIAVVPPGGRPEVRAARDGTPGWDDGRITVRGVHEVDGDLTGEHELLGGAAVRGNVRAGTHLRATGGIQIEGVIERSEVIAGGVLDIDGHAFGAELRAGGADAVRAALRRPLATLPDRLEDLAADASFGRGDAARREAVATLVAGPYADLPPLLRAAEEDLVQMRAGWPNLLPSVAEALTCGRRAVIGAASVDDPVRDLIRAAAVLRAAGASGRAAEPGALRVRRLDGCSVTAHGSVQISGPGARNCHMRIQGDLFCMADGSEIVGGDIRVRGRVRVRELAARNNAPLRIEVGEAGGGEPLRADVVQAGVDLVVGGRVHRFARREKDVRVIVEGGTAYVECRRDRGGRGRR